MLPCSPLLRRLPDNRRSSKSGPDVILVTAACSVCHTPNYIRMNSVFLTPDGWTAEVTKMRKIYGAQFDETTAAIIIKYLSETYAVPPKS